MKTLVIILVLGFAIGCSNDALPAELPTIH